MPRRGSKQIKNLVGKDGGERGGRDTQIEFTLTRKSKMQVNGCGGKRFAQSVKKKKGRYGDTQIRNLCNKGNSNRERVDSHI